MFVIFEALFLEASKATVSGSNCSSVLTMWGLPSIMTGRTGGGGGGGVPNREVSPPPPPARGTAPPPRATAPEAPPARAKAPAGQVFEKP